MIPVYHDIHLLNKVGWTTQNKRVRVLRMEWWHDHIPTRKDSIEILPGEYVKVYYTRFDFNKIVIASIVKDQDYLGRELEFEELYDKLLEQGYELIHEWNRDDSKASAR